MVTAQAAGLGAHLNAAGEAVAEPVKKAARRSVAAAKKAAEDHLGGGAE